MLFLLIPLWLRLSTCQDLTSCLCEVSEVSQEVLIEMKATKLVEGVSPVKTRMFIRRR